MRLSVWYSVLSVLVAIFGLPSPGYAQDGSVLLQAEGVLEAGDATLDDGSLYDSYRFEGQAGQAVIITVTSDEFDTYLFLRDGNGATLAKNDDWNGETDSTIGYVLPAKGSYELWINSYDQTGQGSYQINVLGTESSNIIVRESEADRLNQQGVALTNQAKYPAALELFQQSLAIRQEIGDRRGEGESLKRLPRILCKRSKINVHQETALWPARKKNRIELMS